MALFKRGDVIQEGDAVVLFAGREDIHWLTMKKGGEVHGKFGKWKHDDMIGKPFGTALPKDPTYFPRGGNSYLLHPSLIMWRHSLKMRTQIVQPHDMHTVMQMLSLRPGFIVLESGTGSGATTHGLISAVKPTGHVFTFEYHEQRALKAAEEFDQNGLHDFVTVTHRDVCKEGFKVDGKEAQTVGGADALFLDVPAPWDAMDHAHAALKPGALMCSYSPCIEQVQRAIGEMERLGFREIKTVEVVMQKMRHNPSVLPRIALWPDGEELPPIEKPHPDAVAANKRKKEAKKEAKEAKKRERQAQMKQQRDAKDGAKMDTDEPAAKKGNGGAAGSNKPSEQEQAAEKKEAQEVKKEEEGEEEEEEAMPQNSNEGPVPAHLKNIPPYSTRTSAMKPVDLPPLLGFHTTTYGDNKGHTSYLTFAKKH